MTARDPATTILAARRNGVATCGGSLGLVRGAARPGREPGSPFERWPRLTLFAVVLAGAGLLAGSLELAYRAQALDFYRAELLRNPTPALAPDGRPVLLVLGDSFTADPEGFVATLRAALPAWRVVGAGVSGFSSRQLLRTAPSRLAQFQPRAVLVQLYAGNDLVERLHPAELKRPTTLRGLFWMLSDLGLESPGWVNYRSGQALDAIGRWRTDPLTARQKAALEARPFAPELFTDRDRALCEAAPGHIEDQLALSGSAAPAFDLYAAELAALLHAARRSGAETVVLPVPHAVQAAPGYLARYEALGARFARRDWAEVEAPYQARLRELAAARGGRWVDPLPDFRRAEAAGTVLYRHNDSHLAPAGTELLGQVAAAAQREPR